MTPLIAAVDWLTISINLLLVIHVIICLLLALVVLMQRPKQEGLGAAFGSGLTDQAFGARTTDVLQKGTVYLGTLFFVVTLVLAILIGKRQNTQIDMSDTSEKDVPAETVPNVPTEAPEAPVVMPGSPDADSKESAPAEDTDNKDVPAEDKDTATEEPSTGSEETPASSETGEGGN
ncbi:preprotein translocase subunit SecG [Verrucomicrobiaceae bacterium N1E253]|uniref:Protein-export membrane protein SecG n=1 Tax=Oceaniferula marina TaxID=2748318 RepID=A0A851GJI2_9BACT|nr:preprotein translocase subunit SecG [Oceaniferula marina]NWK54344.1 preprotein translocase subunit SecG [Oceaniferula marina]